MDRNSLPNPFDMDVVPDPDSPTQADVPRIHEGAFELCRRAYERVSGGAASWSVLFFGDAGCGKTHLLSRFRNWLEAQAKVKPAVFVAVRMETGPGHIWRHVRRRLIEELLRRQADGSTKLDAVLGRHAAASPGNVEDALDSVPIRDLGAELTKVLKHWQAGRQRRLCRAWLLGDSVSESELEALNLPQPAVEGPDEDVAEYEARRVVLALIRLCEPAPAVFCFDQMEALALSQQTKSFGAFSRLGASLIDETRNTLIISTVLSKFVQDLEYGSNYSDFQRITKDQADLEPLDWELGKLLVDARLSVVPELANMTPIREDELRGIFEANEGRVMARRLIHDARRLFARWQSGKETARVPVSDFLRAELERHWTEAEVRTNPQAADAVISQGLPVALQIMGRTVREKPAKTVDLSTGTGLTTVYIAFANHTNMHSLAGALKRLQRHAPLNGAMCIIRDDRLPVAQEAKQAQQRIGQIIQKGGRLVRASSEGLAAIDAMRHLLARATSGELVANGETVDQAAVREWLERNIPRQAGKLMEDILREEIQEFRPSFDALLELLQKRKVLPLGEAAKLSGLTGAQIEEYARAHPDRVGLFGGASPVVCDPAPALRKETNGVVQ